MQRMIHHLESKLWIAITKVTLGSCCSLGSCLLNVFFVHEEVPVGGEGELLVLSPMNAVVSANTMCTIQFPALIFIVAILRVITIGLT